MYVGGGGGGSVGVCVRRCVSETASETIVSQFSGGTCHSRVSQYYYSTIPFAFSTIYGDL